MIPNYLNSFITDKVLEMCRGTGHICPHWPHEDIIETLKDADKLDQGNRVDRYLNQCHSLQVVYRPDIQKFFIRCRCIDYNLPDLCQYSNAKVCIDLLEEIDKQ